MWPPPPPLLPLLSLLLAAPPLFGRILEESLMAESEGQDKQYFGLQR
jgi:hypothetical protein